jgi:hypothetical protein
MEMKTGLDWEVIRKISAHAAIEIETPVVDPADSIKRNRCVNLETKPLPLHTQQRQCIIKVRIVWSGHSGRLPTLSSGATKS